MSTSSIAAEQCQEFCPSSVKHGLLQPQRVAPFHRARPQTLQEGARRHKEHSEFGRPLSRTSARKKALKMADERQAPIEKPLSRVASLGIPSFELSCCSDIYTSAGGSAEHSSHPGSVYIYAESIKGGDTSSTGVSQEWDSLCLHAEIEKTCDVVRDPRSETTEIGSSMVALLGSDTSSDGGSIGGDYNSDSSCVNAEWEQSFDYNNDSFNLVCSSAEAQWGSASWGSGSIASGYMTDYDLESSFPTTERHGGSDFGSHFKAGHGVVSVGHFDSEHSDSSGGQFETSHGASLVHHFERGYHDAPDAYLEAGNWDLTSAHFDTGHCDLPVNHVHTRGCDSGHFEKGHHNSPVRDFEAGCHDELPVGNFEAGHCDSPVGCFEAGLCDPLDGHIDKASCDLYNAVPESSGAVCYSDEKHKHLFYFEDSCEPTWRKLQGVVTHPDRYHVAPFLHEMMKDTGHDRNQEKVKINKGFLFHPHRVQTCTSFIKYALMTGHSRNGLNSQYRYLLVFAGKKLKISGRPGIFHASTRAKWIVWRCV